MSLSGVCFLDNDVILKLAAYEFLEETINALNVNTSNLRALDSAKYVFRKQRRIAKVYSEDIRENALQFLSQCQSVTSDLCNEDEIIQLTKIDGIDEGEILLIAATRSEESFILMTGDKRCLKALAAAPDLDEIKQRLQGRVICLEQIILLLIKTQGFETVRSKILPASIYDKALGACFGSGEIATQKNVIHALEGYISDLNKSAPGFLVSSLAGYPTNKDF